MTTGRTNRALRGFLVHHHRIDLDHLSPNTGDPASDYNEAAPQPGTAVPSDPLSTYTIRAHSAQHEDLFVGVIRPGLPGIDRAGASYREDAEANSAMRGWNEPNLFQGVHVVDWGDDPSWFSVDAVTIPSTQVVVAIGADAAGTVGTQAWVWTPASRTWSSRVQISSALDDSVGLLLLRRTERIVAYRFTEGTGTVRAHFSDDAGASWSQYDRDGGIGVTLDSSADRIALVEDRNGAVLMMATDITSGNWWLYRSEDSGVTFVGVESGSALGARQSLVLLADGRILLVYREQTTNLPKYIVLDDAYDTMSGKSGTALDGAGTAGFIAPVVDSDGVVYVYLTVSSSDVVKVKRSTDHATTFTGYTHDAISQSMSLATRTDYRTQISCAASSGGEILCMCTAQNLATNPASDESLLALRFGGWSNLEARGGVARTSRQSFGGTGESSVWLPSDTLDTQGWTLVGTTNTVASGRWRYVTTGTACSTHMTDATALSGGSTQFFDVTVVSGTPTFLRIERATRKLELRAFSGGLGGFEAYDVEAGATFGGQITWVMSAPTEFKVVWASDSAVTIFYRRRGSSIWLKGQQKTGMVAGIGVQQFYRIGVLDNVSAEATFGFFATTDHAMLHDVVDDSPYLNDLSWGKSLSASPYPVRDQGGDTGQQPRLHLSAVGGASRFNEQFQIPARRDYALRHIFPQIAPGPDRRWRSISLGEKLLAFDLTGLSQNSRVGSSWSLALCLVGVNFRTAYLETRQTGGSWETVGTYDGAVLVDGAFDRSGDLVRPASSSSAASRFWAAGELAGGLWIPNPGSPRRILWNSAGSWYGGSPHPPVLVLSGIDGTEATSGTATIVAPGGVLVAHPGTPTAYRRVRLRIPTTQATAETYFEIGQLVLGSLLIPGRQWSRGWSWREEPLVRLEEDDQGVLWPERRGPVRRELTVAWQDGYDLSDLRQGIGARYLSPSESAPALAADQDVWWQLAALLREAGDGELPVVALKSVPPVTSTVTDPSLWIYGVLSGVLQANNVQGDEGKSEVYRVESLTVREQPWNRTLGLAGAPA